MIQVFPASSVSPKIALDMSSSFVLDQWEHFHSKPFVGFEPCTMLPVEEELPFAPIANVCLVN
jgi:hypothetical protein